MWSIFRSYRNLDTRNKNDENKYPFADTFTSIDAVHLKSTSGSTNGRLARKKLILAVTEDDYCFRELKKQLRMRRLMTHCAISHLMMEDCELTAHMSRQVQERGVVLTKEKQIAQNIVSPDAKTYNNNIARTANSLLQSIKGLSSRDVGNVNQDSWLSDEHALSHLRSSSLPFGRARQMIVGPRIVLKHSQNVMDPYTAVKTSSASSPVIIQSAIDDATKVVKGKRLPLEQANTHDIIQNNYQLSEIPSKKRKTSNKELEIEEDTVVLKLRENLSKMCLNVESLFTHVTQTQLYGIRGMSDTLVDMGPLLDEKEDLEDASERILLRELCSNNQKEEQLSPSEEMLGFPARNINNQGVRIKSKHIRSSRYRSRAPQRKKTFSETQRFMLENVFSVGLENRKCL